MRPELATNSKYLSISKLLPCQKHTYLVVRVQHTFASSSHPLNSTYPDVYTSPIFLASDNTTDQRTMKIARESDFDTTTKRYDYTQKKKRFGLFWGVLLDIQWSFNWGLGWRWKRPCFRTFFCVYMRLAICESWGGGVLFPSNQWRLLLRECYALVVLLSV